MKKIQKLGKIIRILASVAFYFIMVIAVIAIPLLLFVSIPDDASTKIAFNGLDIPFRNPDIISRILLCLVFILPVLVFETATFYVIKLFKLFEKGIIFARENVQYIKSISKMLILWAFAKPFADYGAHEFAKFTKMSADLDVSIGIDGTALVVGIFILIVSWIMDEGRKLQEEQELTI